MAHSTDSDEPGSAPIALVAAIKYSEFVPSQCVPGIGAMKTGVILSSAPLSQEPEPERHGEPQDSSTLLSTIIESACDVNGVHQASLSYDPEGDDDDETFDYKGIDWEPRASGVPTPPPSSEICTIALPCSSPEPRFKHSRAPLKSQNESMSRSLSTSPREPALQSSTMYALDDIQVGVKCKNEAEVAYSTRRRFKRASADDLRAMIGLVQATPFPVPDCGPVTPLHNVTDKGIAIKEVALLREDLPIFTARTSAIGQEVASFAGPPQPVFAGLRASIHAPRNDDLSRTELQEYVGTSDSAYEKQASSFPTESQTRSHSPDLVSTADEIQVSTHSAPKPGSQEYTNPATLESSTSQTSRLESSTIAPADADATVIQTRKEPVETLVPPTIVGPNVLRGLAASIHAPQGCPSNQAKRERAVHSADAPNWATAAREDSMAASRGSSPAQLGNTPNQRLDDGDEPDVPTATRRSGRRSMLLRDGQRARRNGRLE
ncbi:hypothetical protein EI94DRAFT_1079414 [Lactarius quietus]|nr:hypothetical protein EI94DRAFT_1079414 [Lactarius quietus]